MRIKSLLKQSVVASSLLVVAPVMVSANDFTGLYAGVHVVHSTGTQDYRYAFSALDRWRFTGTFAEYDLSGQGAGLQLGYRWQLGDSPWRLGLEWSSTKYDITGQQSFAYKELAKLQLSTTLTEQHSLRLQVGRTFEAGDWYAYGFAGVTAANGTLRAKGQLNSFTDTQILYEDDIDKQGWGASPVIGAGIQRMITDRLSVGMEFSQTEYSGSYNRGNQYVQGEISSTIFLQEVGLQLHWHF